MFHKGRKRCINVCKLMRFCDSYTESLQLFLRSSRYSRTELSGGEMKALFDAGPVVFHRSLRLGVRLFLVVRRMRVSRRPTLPRIFFNLAGLLQSLLRAPAHVAGRRGPWRYIYIRLLPRGGGGRMQRLQRQTRAQRICWLN
jgi:hypothetical protein